MRRCRHCQTPLPPGSSATRQFCGSACRQRAGRIARAAPPAERRCEWCDAPIPPTAHRHKKYCSDACRYAARDKGRVRTDIPHCVHCQSPLPDGLGPQAKYCSDECRKAARRVREGRPTGPRRCLVCGEDLSQRGRNAVYCVRHRDGGRQERKAAETAVCLWCGADYHLHQKNFKGGYCSKDCGRKGRARVAGRYAVSACPRCGGKRLWASPDFGICQSCGYHDDERDNAIVLGKRARANLTEGGWRFRRLVPDYPPVPAAMAESAGD